jgi:hypothetical protein
MGYDETKRPAWGTFWQINLGHLLIIAGMIGSALTVVNNVETTLANHDSRIITLEHELSEQRAETGAWQQRTTDKLDTIAAAVNNLQGQIAPWQPPQRRGDGSNQASPHDGGG